MKKKLVFLIVLIIIIIIGIITGFIITNRINKVKRSYEIEQVSEYKYFVMKENEKFGVIDKSGKTIIDALYDKVEIPNPSKDVFICYKNEKGTAMNTNNQQLFAEYNSISAIDLKNVVTDLPYEKSVLKSEKNGKYGLIDFSGKEIVDTEYDSIEGLSGIEGELQVQKNEKIGIINIKGTVLVKPEFDTITSDNYYNEDGKHGYIAGQKNEEGYNYCYINYKGKTIIKPEYNDIQRVTDISTEDGIYLIVAKNGQYGVIKNKKNIINNEFQAIEYDKTNKVFIMQKGKSYGVSDQTGKILIPIENTSVQAKGEYIYVEKNNIREVYDSMGNKVNVEFNKTIMPTVNENYKITINSEENSNFYGVINSNRKQIIKSEYLYIEYAFNDYFIACAQNGKLGVLNSNGDTVIEFKYDLVQKMPGKNYIQTLYSDTNTTEIYSEKMEKICEMKNATIENQEDYIKIYSNNELKYIDNNGTFITSSKIFPNNKIYADCKEGKWGYIDENGKTIKDYEFEFATEINECGYGAIKKDGKWGAIDSSGKIIVEPKFELSENYGKVDFIGEYIKSNGGLGIEYYTKNI
ncbi:MAG: WG repeat-containing protein [Clostridia bacterium]|nr:WG repeat-containing protein [Clostridia bacterium]